MGGPLGVVRGPVPTGGNPNQPLGVVNAFRAPAATAPVASVSLGVQIQTPNVTALPVSSKAASPAATAVSAAASPVPSGQKNVQGRKPLARVPQKPTGLLIKK